ncbi:MAG: ATP-binding protein, partial [bacterium]|nr:ATP-binding protein [bacterium]
MLDGHLSFVRELLARWPAITAMRVHEELRGRGFAGGYTIVKDLLRRLRPPRRRVHLFSYVLGHSRRQYLHFVPSRDFEAPIREQVRALEHLQGVGATCLYDNMKVVVAGQSGVGKSHIVQSVGRAACVLGYRVRYVTSAALLIDLTASLADHSLPQCLRRYSNYELLIINEFGFDKIERAESAQAASLLYKVVDSRAPEQSTALVTNISFEARADYDMQRAKDKGHHATIRALA